jgi:hypothetical protein
VIGINLFGHSIPLVTPPSGWRVNPRKFVRQNPTADLSAERTSNRAGVPCLWKTAAADPATYFFFDDGAGKCPAIISLFGRLSFAGPLTRKTTAPAKPSMISSRSCFFSPVLLTSNQLQMAQAGTGFSCAPQQTRRAHGKYETFPTHCLVADLS